MRNTVAALAVLCLLAGCDGNPLVAGLTADDGTTDDGTTDDGTTGDDTTTTDDGTTDDDATTTADGVALTVARNLESIVYDPVAETLFVTVESIDGTPVSAEYTRNAAAEAALPAGYQAYSLQEDALDRFFLAVVKQSTDGSVIGAAVADGGQFNYEFSGGWYQRTGEFTPPEIGTGPGQGQVSYAGDYVGLDDWTGIVPTIPGTADPSTQPRGPGRVTGQVFINANFADMSLNGSIFNRNAIDSAIALDTLVLAVNTINADGTFTGNVEPFGETGNDIGDYAGVFGGVDAASVGIAILIENYTDLVENETETGIMVLTQCGKTGEDATLCAGTAP